MMAKTNPLQFVQQTRSEMAKVVWPTRREVMLTTVMVFIMAALTAIFFGLVDLGIRAGLQAMLSAVS
jgi:preprotein translocase subunit SecE